MPFRTGLAGAVVQRSLADWPVVLAAWLLLVCATTLLATGVVYGDAVATDGLHRALLAAPPADRAVVAAADFATARIDGIDRTVRAELARALGASGGEIARVVRTGSFADRTIAPDQVTNLTTFESIDGIEAHASLVAGAWPTAGGDPIQATLSEAAARTMGVAAGSRLALVSRVDPTVTVDVAIVGTWQANRDDAFWAGDPLETLGSLTVGTFQTRGPIVLREADVVGLVGPQGRLGVSWRGLPDIASLRIDGVDDLRTGIDALAAHLRGELQPSENPRVTSRLPGLLGEVGRSVLVSRSGVILLTIQFAVLAGYAIVLVAGMLVERRRSEIALLRSRGASGLHLVAMAVLEAALLAAPAVLLAPWLALGAVILLGSFGPTAGLGIASSAQVGISAFIVAGIAGLACIVALTLPTLSVSASPAGARAAQGRQARTTLPQRLGLDLALVAVAGVALWQLRLYGAPLTRNARGTLGLDPLLVAAPAIGLVGGAVLALRIVPRVAEMGERLLVRGRGLVSALGGRQLARRPLRYTRTALLLMLAAALGTLAAAHAATWTQSQADQAAYQAAADVRVVASDYNNLPSWAAGPLYRAIPGVVAATPVLESPVDMGRVIRSGKLVGIDPRATQVAATDGVPADRAERERLLVLLAAAHQATAAVPLPGEPRRIAVTLDASFQTDPSAGGDPISKDDQLLQVVALVADGDGRLFRTQPAAGSVAREGQRLVVDLAARDAADLQPTPPLSLAGFEVTIHAPNAAAMHGDATITAVETSEASGGDGGWTALPFDVTGGGWQWQLTADGFLLRYPPESQGSPRFTIGPARPVFGNPDSSGLTARIVAGLGEDAVLPVIASRTLLEQTASEVGQVLAVTSLGQTLHLRIIGATDLFAPYDPATAFLVTDASSLATVRLEATGQTSQADQWLLAVDPARSGDVLAALRRPTSGAATVVGRDELARTLSTDPVPLGLIGVLGLGSLAAMLFAGIGFLVSSTVSTSERLPEFALMRALGLSTGQLALWLSIESIFLLAIGLLAGSFLGLVLAWLVLPFATLTQTGVPPVPAPAVVVPWQAIAPVYLAAIVLFVLSVWLVRRQLPDVRVSGVLRGGESG